MIFYKLIYLQFCLPLFIKRLSTALYSKLIDPFIENLTFDLLRKRQLEMNQIIPLISKKIRAN